MAKASTRTPKSRSARAGDKLTVARIASSFDALEKAGVLAGTRSARLSVRIEPRLVEEAKKRSGIENETDLVRAALALMVEPDDFVDWLGSRKGKLPADFELVR